MYNVDDKHQKSTKKPHKHRHIAFSVSAGCYPYQMGIAHYLQQHFDLDNVFFSGASGGAFAAVLLAADCKIEEVALSALKQIGPECCRGRWLGAYGVYDNGMRSVFNHIFEGVDLPSKVSTLQSFLYNQIYVF